MEKAYIINLKEHNMSRFYELNDDPEIMYIFKLIVDNFKNSTSGIVETPALKLLSKFNFFNIPLQYKKEIKYWQMISNSDEWLYIANTAYEVYAASCNIKKAFFSWCTSCAKYTKKYGMIHMRNMDWPLEGLKDGTVIMFYKGAKAGDFKAVTWPGFSGVISGVAKGRFSASINMNAINDDFNKKGIPVAFILRKAFEKCRTYGSAVNYIYNQDVMAPAFVHLVGMNTEDNCIIGLNPDQNYVWYPSKCNIEPFAVTNHNIDDKDYTDKKYEMDSEERRRFILKSADKINNPKSALSILMKRPIMNEETKQSMVMLPKTGEIFLNNI